MFPRVLEMFTFYKRLGNLQGNTANTWNPRLVCPQLQLACNQKAVTYSGSNWNWLEKRVERIRVNERDSRSSVFLDCSVSASSIILHILALMGISWSAEVEDPNKSLVEKKVIEGKVFHSDLAYRSTLQSQMLDLKPPLFTSVITRRYKEVFYFSEHLEPGGQNFSVFFKLKTVQLEWRTFSP